MEQEPNSRHLVRLGNTSRFVLSHLCNNGPSSPGQITEAAIEAGLVRRGVYKALHLLNDIGDIRLIDIGPPAIYDLTPSGIFRAGIYLGNSGLTAVIENALAASIRSRFPLE